MKTRDIVNVSMAAAFISILSLISIPLPSGMPLTLQTFAVAFSGYYCGAKYGVCAVFIYILLGSLGLPIFSGGQAGFSVLFGATGGFLVGFLFFAAFCGIGRKHKRLAIFFGFSGLMICHLCGTVQFAFVTDRGLIEAFLVGSLPYILKDAISVVFSYLFCDMIKKRTKSL